MNIMNDLIPSELRFAAGDRPGETLAGLLVVVADYAQTIGFFDTLLADFRLPMKVYAYTPRQKVQALVATILAGCRHTVELQTKLAPDPVAPRLFGLDRFPDQSQLNALLRACSPAQVAQLEAGHARLLAAHSRAGERTAWLALPDGTRRLPLDLDQTYLATRSTKATGAARGYFGRKRSQYGYHKTVALLGGSVREVLWQQLEPGDSHAQAAVPTMLERLAALLRARGIRPREVLIRGDAQYGSVGVVRQVQAAGHEYVLKGYTPLSARALAQALPPETVWHAAGTDSYGSQLWVAEAGEQELRGHDDQAGTPPVRTRVVLLARVSRRTRRPHGKAAQVSKVVRYEHYLTSRSAAALSAPGVLALYNGRETEESFFRSEQDAFGAQYLRTHHGDGEAVFLWLLASTINLLRWTQHGRFTATPLETAGLTKLVTHALRLPASVIETTQGWLVLLPERVRLVHHLLSAWHARVAQLPLPAFGDTS
jgi:hypothetical protein